MCTALSLVAENGDVVFGRTMDFSYELSPGVYDIPAGHRLPGSTAGIPLVTTHSFTGVGQSLPDAPNKQIFADGANDAGLGIAALYFPGYAHYDDAPAAASDAESRTAGRITVSSTDIPLYILGMCSSIEEAIALMCRLTIIGEPDFLTESIAPLHWILSDISGRCIVAEKTSQGMQCYDNPAGALTNSPDFPWQLTNLRRYTQVVPQQSPLTRWGDTISVSPFGQGAGTTGLPGDFTSPGRFVRTAWLASHTVDITDGEDAMHACLQILGNVSIPRGAVVTDRCTFDYTQYIIIYNLTDGTYLKW